MLGISILKKNRLKRLLRFGLYTSLLFTIIFYIDTNDFHVSQLVLGFIFGVLVGILEEVTSHRKYVTVSLPLQFLVKFIGIILITMGLMSLVFMYYQLSVEDLRTHIRQKEVSSPLVLSFIVSIVIITYFQIEKLIGKNMLANYLKGRYRRPKRKSGYSCFWI
jgi:hypothetical protein